MPIDLEAVRAAIEGTRNGLEAAGFDLDTSVRDGRLVLTILGGEAACAECLVPKPVMTAIVAAELNDKGLAVDRLEIIYPVEAGAESG